MARCSRRARCVRDGMGWGRFRGWGGCRSCRTRCVARAMRVLEWRERRMPGSTRRLVRIRCARTRSRGRGWRWSWAGAVGRSACSLPRLSVFSFSFSLFADGDAFSAYLFFAEAGNFFLPPASGHVWGNTRGVSFCHMCFQHQWVACRIPSIAIAVVRTIRGVGFSEHFLPFLFFFFPRQGNREAGLQGWVDGCDSWDDRERDVISRGVLKLREVAMSLCFFWGGRGAVFSALAQKAAFRMSSLR